MIREHLGGVIERMEKMRDQARVRAETAAAQAQAYAEVIEELRRLDGIAIADEVLRGRVREIDQAEAKDEIKAPTGMDPLPPAGVAPCTTCGKVCFRVARGGVPVCVPPTEDDPAPPASLNTTSEGLEPAPQVGAPASLNTAPTPKPERKGSPPCPLCQCGTIVYRKTGRLICLNEECPNSKTGQESQTRKTEEATTEEETEDGGRAIDIGNGRQELADGTNLSACVNAIGSRSPHWLSTAGILEVVRQNLRRDLPETMSQIIAQEMTKQRKLRTFKVPGLQARQVDARRWEYRIVESAKPERD